MEKSEFIEAFKKRTKQLALDVIRFSQHLPNTEEAKIMKRQLLRSGTSVAANYRAACRARSSAEFYAKVSIVIEEVDETLFWLELLSESGTAKVASTKELETEVLEILSVMSKARKNIKR